ncbi:tetratricopeptide repeat protein [Streptomyces bobili]
MERDGEAISQARATRKTRLIARPKLPPGPLRALKTLIYEAYVEAGAPTLDTLATAIAADDDLTASPSRDTIARIIGDPVLPAKQADAVAVVTVLTRMFGGNGQQAGDEAAALWRQLQLSEPLGRPVRQIDPYDLEVHHEITWRDVTGLAPYVERDHDIALRRLVTEAAHGTSHLVMLVGSSSSGKTRACYEAVHALPDDWRLWHPIDPGRPKAALSDLHRIGPQTVVWLNEAHHYLLHPDHGEQIAAGLRTILADATRAPVLVLGTIWPGPGYFDELLTPPPQAGSERGPLAGPTHQPKVPDPHGQARYLLAGRALHVPSAFTPREIDMSRRSDDLRLAAAARSAQDGMVTQYLAAGFDLVASYTTALPGPKALLTAAIDARRLGHPPSLPLPFLAAAAEGYLTDTEWELLEDDWLEQALTRLTKGMKGARGPLHRSKRPRGVTALPARPPAPTYLLADFLVDHFRTVRRTQPIPDFFWQAAVEHTQGEGARALASAAASRGLAETACRLWAKAGEFTKIAGALADASRLDEALPWYERAQRSGDAEAARTAIQKLIHAGRLDETAQWLARTPKQAKSQTMRHTAEVMAKEGHLDEAMPWFQAAHREGDSASLLAAGRALADADRLTQALLWFEQATAAGDEDALVEAVECLLEAGRRDEALQWVERAAREGHHWASAALTQQLAAAGRPDHLLAWHAQIYPAGPSGAASATGWQLELENAVLRLEPSTSRSEVTGGAEESAESEDDTTHPHGAPPEWRTRPLGEVSAWAARNEQRVNSRFLAEASRAASTGRLSEALILADQAAAEGEAGALLWAAQHLAGNASWAEAFTWCQRAVAAGSELAAHLAVVSLQELGRGAEAERLERYGWSLQGGIAAAWSLEPPA